MTPTLARQVTTRKAAGATVTTLSLEGKKIAVPLFIPTTMLNSNKLVMGS